MNGGRVGLARLKELAIDDVCVEGHGDDAFVQSHPFVNDVAGVSRQLRRKEVVRTWRNPS